MKTKERLIRWALALCVFVLAFGALMYYLRYEGVTRYNYIFADTPDLTLTVQDAASVSVVPESAQTTALRQNQTLTFDVAGRTVGAVRVHYENQIEPYVTAQLSYTLSDGSGTYSMKGVSRRDTREIVFSIPPHPYDSLTLRISALCGVERIETYEHSYYPDESKQVPHLLNAGMALLLSALLALSLLASGAELRTGRGFGLPALLLMLEIAVMRLCLQTRRYDAYSMGVEIVLLAAFAVATLALLAAYRMLFVRKTPVYRVFALCGAVMGLIFVFLTQPFMVPDEGAHYNQAHMFLSGRPDGYAIRGTDQRFREKYEGELGDKSTYLRYVMLMEEFKPFNDNCSVKDVTAKKVKNVPLGYVVTGLAAGLAKALNFSGAALFYFGRLANLAAYIALMALTIYLMPVGKIAVMCLALSPVSLQQAASYSYDPVVMSLAFVFTAYVLRLCDQREAVSLWQYGMLCVLGMLLAPSKIAYAPMVCAMFLIPLKHYGFGRRRWFLPLLTLVLSGAALIVMQAGTVGASVSLGDSASRSTYTVSQLIGDPRGTVNVFLRTFEVMSDFYYDYLFCRYMAWHQLDAYAWLSALLTVVFVLACQRSDEERLAPLGAGKRWGVLLALLLTMGLVMTSMLLAWTPAGHPFIEGVQGRYFIPALILLIPALRNGQITVKTSAHGWCAMLAVWGSILTVIRVLQVMPAA